MVKDVYKRQPKKMIDDILNGTDYNVRFKYNSLFTKTSKEFNKKWPGVLSVMMDRLTTVSYTHLDVYKRQANNKCILHT